MLKEMMERQRAKREEMRGRPMFHKPARTEELEAEAEAQKQWGKARRQQKAEYTSTLSRKARERVAETSRRVESFLSKRK